MNKEIFEGLSIDELQTALGVMDFCEEEHFDEELTEDMIDYSLHSDSEEWSDGKKYSSMSEFWKEFNAEGDGV